jgi:hypothetical protein
VDLGATATSGVRCRSLDMWHLRIGTGCSSSECRVCLTIGHRQTPMLYLLFYAKKTPKSAILVHFGWYILVYWYTPFQDTHFLKLPIWVCRYSPNSRLSALRFLDRPILAKGEDDPVGYRMTETILLSRVTWRSEMPESKGGKHVERRWNKGVSISILDCYFVVHTKQCEPTPQWRYILTHQVFGSALLDGRWDPQPFLPRAKDDFSQESSKLQHRKSSCGLPHDSFLKSLGAFGTAGRIPLRLRVYHSCHIHKWRGFRRCSCVDLRTDLGMDQNPQYLIFGLNLHVPARGSPGYQCFEPSPSTKMSTPLSQLYLIWALWLHHDFF